MRIKVDVTASKDEYYYNDDTKAEASLTLMTENSTPEDLNWESLLAGLVRKAIVEHKTLFAAEAAED